MTWAPWENGQNGRVELYGIARRFSEQRTQRNEFALGHQGTFAPWEVDGKMEGAFVSIVKPGSFYQQLGISQGDILLAVNDVPISSVEVTKDILKMFMEDTELRLQVKRADEESELKTNTLPVQ